LAFRRGCIQRHITPRAHALLDPPIPCSASHLSRAHRRKNRPARHRGAANCLVGRCRTGRGKSAVLSGAALPLVAKKGMRASLGVAADRVMAAGGTRSRGGPDRGAGRALRGAEKFRPLGRSREASDVEARAAHRAGVISGSALRRAEVGLLTARAGPSPLLARADVALFAIDEGGHCVFSQMGARFSGPEYIGLRGSPSASRDVGRGIPDKTANGRRN